VTFCKEKVYNQDMNEFERAMDGGDRDLDAFSDTNYNEQDMDNNGD